MFGALIKRASANSAVLPSKTVLRTTTLDSVVLFQRGQRNSLKMINVDGEHFIRFRDKSCVFKFIRLSVDVASQSWRNPSQLLQNGVSNYFVLQVFTFNSFATRKRRRLSIITPRTGNRSAMKLRRVVKNNTRLWRNNCQVRASFIPKTWLPVAIHNFAAVVVAPVRGTLQISSVSH